MNRDGRYGAFLVLAAVFLSVSFFHFSKTSFRSKNSPTLPVNDDVTAASSSQTAASPVKPPSKTAEPKPEKEGPGFRIDLNSATKEDLLSLPGIGEVTAERILKKRIELGGFTTVEELTEVERIGKVKMDRIRGLVTVKNGPPKPKNP
ncbi:MAG: helix-hairpin-helix domain-containing protein [Deltaproteobacteria bacterium]|nr:helix-hairpin-helix domain-containing protein [Deltaproteobacteria bacterium]